MEQHSVSTGDQPPIIVVENLSKRYQVYDNPWKLLKGVLWGVPAQQERWALRDVSFSVRRGDIVGLVGGNGAGKSTLLRILAGVLDASGGRVHIDGQLRAILELGTGFHDNYTGRQNIFMGGYCLGYTKEQIQESLEWIIEFSGLGEVIDQQFRTYSSGMKARLTFAVTFCRRPEILIVDEALAVGDLAFTAKCVNRITELCSEGATALVVSHNMYFMERLCQRVLYLRKGRIVADGPPQQICRRYEEELLEEFTRQQSQRAGVETPTSTNPACPAQVSDAEIQRLLDDPDEVCPPILHLRLVRLIRARVVDADGRERQRFHVGEPLRIEITVDSQVEKQDILVGLQVFHEGGVHVLTTNNRWHLTEQGRPTQVRLDLRKGLQTFVVEFPHLFLGAGNYFGNIGINPKEKHFSPVDLLMWEKRCLSFGFYREDVAFKLIYDAPSQWSAAAKASESYRESA